MAAMSDYLENKLIDHLFRTATFTQPTTLYIELYTVAPSDSGGGTPVSGGSYARIARNPADANWDATQGGNTGASSGTGGGTANTADVTFAAPSANWGTIVAFGVFDALTGGNLLIHGALTANKTVNSGDAAPKFVAGALTVTLA